MDPAAITDKNFGVPMRSSWGKQFYWLCKRYNLHCTYFMDFESITGNSYCRLWHVIPIVALTMFSHSSSGPFSFFEQRAAEH